MEGFNVGVGDIVVTKVSLVVFDILLAERSWNSFILKNCTLDLSQTTVEIVVSK